jgi:hypothetical protein
MEKAEMDSNNFFLRWRNLEKYASINHFSITYRTALQVWRGLQYE